MRTFKLCMVVTALLLFVACDDTAADVEAAVETAAATEASTPEPTPPPEPEPTPEPTPPREPEPTPEPAPTPEPTATSEPEPEQQQVGTRDNPVPLGEAAQVGNWEIRVAETIPDGWNAVPEIQIINDPPEEGRQYFIVRLEATFVGADSSQFWFDFDLSAVDHQIVTYDSFDDTCGIIPDGMDLVGQASTGESVGGNVCWSVRSDGAETLVMVVENWLAFPAERVFFALYEG